MFTFQVFSFVVGFVAGVAAYPTYNFVKGIFAPKTGA